MFAAYNKVSVSSGLIRTSVVKTKGLSIKGRSYLRLSFTVSNMRTIGSSMRRLTCAVLTFSSAQGVTANVGASAGCKTIPGDPQWPSESSWTALNRTVDGRLLVSVPLASVCHTIGIGSYDETACHNSKAEWDYPQTQ